MKRMILVLLVLFAPVMASAHTRWFVEGELPPFEATEDTAVYMSFCVAVMVGVVAIAIYLHQHNMLQLSFLRPKRRFAYERAASTFAMVLGIFLLLAGTHEYLFSPNLTVTAGIPYSLIVVQIVIGLALLFDIATRSFAMVMAVVWVATIYFTGVVSALENFWVLSSATFIAIMGNGYCSIISCSYFRKKLRPFKQYALSGLRLGAGISLVVLGFSEKILAPAFGMNFLNQHHWNFMHKVGLPYSDYLFVLSAGSIEILLGLIFILGIMTRLNALVTAIIFTIPLFILGPIELIGHIPHFAAVTLLLLFGSGGHFMLFSKHKDAQVGVH